MKKLSMILPLALILCFMVGCQNKDTIAAGSCLDWFGAIITLLATVLIPAGVCLAGYIFSNALKSRDINTHYVDLAVQILSDSNSNQYPELREWARKIINKHSGVPMDSKAAEQLLKFGFKSTGSI